MRISRSRYNNIKAHCQVLVKVLFIIILSREIKSGCPEELHCADDVALVSETLEGLKETESLERGIGVRCFAGVRCLKSAVVNWRG